MRLNQYKSGVKDFSELLKITPNDHKAYYNRGICYMRILQIDLAIADFSSALKIKNENPECLYCRGLCFLESGDEVSCLKDFSTALESNIDSKKRAKYRLKRAHIHLNLGNYMNSVEDFGVSLRLISKGSKDYISCIYGRGTSYFMMNNFELAIPDFNKTLEIRRGSEESVKIHIFLGKCFQNLGRFDEAVSHYIEAIKITPNDHTLHFILASCRSKMKDYEKSIVDYTNVIQIDGKHMASYVNRGFCFFRLGSFSRSVEDFSMVIGREFDGIQVSEKVYYCRGLSYFHLQEYELAINDFTLSVEMEPNNKLSFFYRGICYEESGKTKEAICDLSNSLILDGQQPEVYYHLGVCHERNDDFDAAIDAYSKSIELWLNSGSIVEIPVSLNPLPRRALLYLRERKYGLGIADYLRVREIMFRSLYVDQKIPSESLQLVRLVEREVDQFMNERIVDVEEYVRYSRPLSILGSGNDSVCYKVNNSFLFEDTDDLNKHSDEESESGVIFFAAKVFKDSAKLITPSVVKSNTSNENPLDSSKYVDRRKFRSKEEALVLFSLDHENVVKCHGWNEGGLLIELGAQGNVITYIQKHKVPWKIKLDWLYQVADCMCYLHDSCGLCHRDLKWENIVIMNGSLKDIKLIDFGFAKDVSVIRSNLESKLGSLYYCAPEICANFQNRFTFATKSYNRKVDVFSFGVMFFILYFEVKYSRMSSLFYESFSELRDPSWSPTFPLQENGSTVLDERCVHIMKLCMKVDCSERPDFVEIRKELEELEQLSSK